MRAAARLSIARQRGANGRLKESKQTKRNGTRGRTERKVSKKMERIKDARCGSGEGTPSSSSSGRQRKERTRSTRGTKIEQRPLAGSTTRNLKLERKIFKRGQEKNTKPSPRKTRSDRESDFTSRKRNRLKVEKIIRGSECKACEREQDR